MAYFDSAKNRALWEKELSELRAEKAARANGASRQRAAANQVPRENDMLREHQVARAYNEPEVVSLDLDMEETAFAAESHVNPTHDNPVRSHSKPEPIREKTSYWELVAEEAASVKQQRAKNRTLQKENTMDYELQSGSEF